MMREDFLDICQRWLDAYGLADHEIDSEGVLGPPMVSTRDLAEHILDEIERDGLKVIRA